jgi:hypothetical protein
MAKFNLNLSDSAYTDVSDVASRLDISMADVVREALSLLLWIIREISAGNRLLIQRGDQVTEVVVPELERLRDPPRPKRPRPAKPDLAPSN